MDILDKLVDFAQLTGSVDVQCLLGGQWSVRHETLQREGLVHMLHRATAISASTAKLPRVRSVQGILYFSRAAWVMC